MAVTFDLMTLATSADPYPVYAKLRESSRVLYLEPMRMFLVSGYDHTCAILKDHDQFSSELSIGGGGGGNGITTNVKSVPSI